LAEAVPQGEYHPRKSNGQGLGKVSVLRHSPLIIQWWLQWGALVALRTL